MEDIFRSAGVSFNIILFRRFCSLCLLVPKVERKRTQLSSGRRNFRKNGLAIIPGNPASHIVISDYLSDSLVEKNIVQVTGFAKA
jgi:hypothetical protein